MVKVKKTKVALSQKPQLDPEEQYWKEVDQLAHYQIANLLNQVLPLPNLRDKKNLDLEKDADYRALFFEFESYSEDLLEPKILAEMITYDYLLLVVKSILRKLSNFNCHSEFYNLTE